MSAKPKKKFAKSTRGMVCPTCSVMTEVLYSRPRAGGSHRRRECPKCGWRGTSGEKWLNVPAPGSTGRTPEPLSITDLLKTIRESIADIETSVTIPSTGEKS